MRVSTALCPMALVPGQPWLPCTLVLPGDWGLEAQRTTLGRDSPGPPTHLMGLRSGHLPLQHPFLCFLSMLNASLPCVGAG